MTLHTDPTPTPSGGRRQTTHPARRVLLTLLATGALGTAALMLPGCAAGPAVGPRVALFTAVSALTGTGLSLVDVPASFSLPGELVLVALMQAGGLGVMVAVTLLGRTVAHRLGIGHRAVTGDPGERPARAVLAGVARISLGVELVVWLVTTWRLAAAHGEPWGRAAYQGLFHAVSAFTNTGLTPWPGQGRRLLAGDPWLMAVTAVAVLLGGLGYPVLLEVDRRRPWRRWSVHARLTVIGTAVVLAIALPLVAFTESRHHGTLGAAGVQHPLLAALFSAVSPRSAGFAVVDYAAVRPATLLLTIGLMLVGTGSAGTGGGIKVGTVAVLTLAMATELRGRRDVTAFGRRIAKDTVRQAVSVAMVSVGAVGLGSYLLLLSGPFELDDAAFEAVSAFTSSGLSTGLTPRLPVPGQLLLVLLMLLGKIGPVALATAMALRRVPQHVRFPIDRPLIG